MRPSLGMTFAADNVPEYDGIEWLKEMNTRLACLKNPPGSILYHAPDGAYDVFHPDHIPEHVLAWIHEVRNRYMTELGGFIDEHGSEAVLAVINEGTVPVYRFGNVAIIDKRDEDRLHTAARRLQDEQS